MERTLRFRHDVVEKIPGEVTGRLQTGKKEWNERFHALLRAFYERTGVPILLNTGSGRQRREVAAEPATIGISSEHS